MDIANFLGQNLKHTAPIASAVKPVNANAVLL